MLNRPWVRYLVLPALFVGGVAVAHLLPGVDGSDLERHIRNSFHIIGFAGVAWILYEVAPFGRLGKALSALVGAVVLGAIAESAQKFAGFTFSINDIYRDAAGAGLIILARLLWAQPAPKLAKYFLRILAIAAVAAVLSPFSYWSWGMLSERLKAPVITDFEGRFSGHNIDVSNAEMALVPTDIADAHADIDGRFAEIMLSRSPRSGIQISTALFDWQPYEYLVFDAYIVAGPESSVSVHINDYNSIGHYKDTQSGMVTVSGDRVSHRVPIRSIVREAGRRDDIGDIRQVVFFARSRNRGAVMRIDNVRLE